MSTPTCEYTMSWYGSPVHAVFCGREASWRYPSMGGGYMHLCEGHAQRHLDSAGAIGMERIEAVSGGAPTEEAG